MPAFGEVLEAFDVGRVHVSVRYSCASRDLYEIRFDGSLPGRLREELGARGSLKGSADLYVVDVPHVHQLTVAPAAGRLVIMPRVSCARADQRREALGVAELVASMLSG